MVLSGMSTPEQAQDNTSYMKEFRPLSEEEKKIKHEGAGTIYKSLLLEVSPYFWKICLSMMTAQTARTSSAVHWA